VTFHSQSSRTTVAVGHVFLAGRVHSHSDGVAPSCCTAENCLTTRRAWNTTERNMELYR
jgi:hypothetical protein